MYPLITLLAWILDYTVAKSYRVDLMPEQSIMVFDEGFNRGIRCRYISEWFRVDSYVNSKEDLLLAIERNIPDAVVMDLELYSKIGGIEISRIIRNQFNVPVMYFESYKP